MSSDGNTNHTLLQDLLAGVRVTSSGRVDLQRHTNTRTWTPGTGTQYHGLQPSTSHPTWNQARAAQPAHRRGGNATVQPAAPNNLGLIWGAKTRIKAGHELAAAEKLITYRVPTSSLAGFNIFDIQKQPPALTLGSPNVTF
ncbi:hypothetical protein WJX72_004487 [[Myrmecia] bisecta]|uniref:Uncharacterized protein n=1 Tax=[Myrmecia] bisecta TaxID=41462 RepID=A0AAW1P5L4_9CHLO